MTTGTCTACALPFSLRVDGTVRTHGPYKNRCPGSNQPPVVEEAVPAYGTLEWDIAAAAVDEDMRRDLAATYGSGQPLERIIDVFDPVLAEVGDRITSILDEAYPDTVPTGNGDVPEVVRWMAAEHNDLLRMADYRTLERWAADKRDEIQARSEERAVRNARYDRALEQWVATARDMLAAVTA